MKTISTQNRWQLFYSNSLLCKLQNFLQKTSNFYTKPLTIILFNFSAMQTPKFYAQKLTILHSTSLLCKLPAFINPNNLSHFLLTITHIFKHCTKQHEENQAPITHTKIEYHCVGRPQESANKGKQFKLGRHRRWFVRSSNFSNPRRPLICLSLTQSFFKFFVQKNPSIGMLGRIQTVRFVRRWWPLWMVYCHHKIFANWPRSDILFIHSRSRASPFSTLLDLGGSRITALHFMCTSSQLVESQCAKGP
jgi:hypothetical protein